MIKKDCKHYGTQRPQFDNDLCTQFDVNMELNYGAVVSLRRDPIPCINCTHYEKAKAKKPKIIAVDFDGTLCVNKFPEIGDPILSVIARVKAEQEKGSRLILWTCRINERLTAAIEWCAEQGIHFEAVNENLPDIVKAFCGDTRKIFANEYWDDRAVVMP